MGLFTFIQIAVCYALLYVAFPYLCLGYIFCKQKAIVKFWCSLIIGNFAIMAIVYLLLFFGIFSKIALIISLILFALLSQLIGSRKRLINIQNSLLHLPNNIALLRYKFKNWLHAEPQLHKFSLAMALSVFIRIGIVASIGYGLFVRLYPSIAISYYSAPDVYVHQSWIANILSGKIFPSGIYPLGFHNAIIAFATIFPFDLITIMQMWGGISFILTLIGFITLTFRLFKSPITRLTLIWLFCASDIFVFSRYIDYRYGVAIPQEFALVFLIPALLFFMDYLSERKTFQLVFTALCFGLAILIHFYAAILLVFMYLIAIALNFRTVFSKKVFLHLATAFLFITILTALPIAVGRLQGRPYERSIAWATGLTSKTPSNSSSTMDKTLEEQNILIKIGSLMRDELAISFLANKEKLDAVKNSATNGGGSVARINTPINFHNYNENTFPNGLNIYTVPFYFSILSAIALIWLRRKNGENVKLKLWLLLFCATLFCLSVSYLLGFPQVIALTRQRTVFRFFALFIFGFLPEMLVYLSKNFKHKGICIASKAILALLLLWMPFSTLVLGRMAAIPISMQAQYGKTVETIKKIRREFPDRSYIIASTTSELPLVMDRGYHYELLLLLQNMEGENAQKDQTISAGTIFFFTEKISLPTYRVVDPSFADVTSIPGQPVTLDAGRQPLPEHDGSSLGLADFYYVHPDNRHIVMSKAYLWAEEFMKLHPDEMTIYYEDDDIAFYLLQQSFDALNNLTINYANAEQ